MALLPTDPQRQKQLLIGIVPLLALFGYGYFVHGAITDEVAQMEERLERLEASNTHARSLVAREGDDLERRIAAYEEHMTRIEELIPSTEEVPELLLTMNLRAEDAGVELALIRPHTEEVGPYYTRKLYEVTVLGSYHDIGRFLAAIGSMRRIITPVGLRLATNNASAEREQARLEADFRIETYVLQPRPTEEAPADVET